MKTETSSRYYIHVECFYYSGTFNAPKSGFLRGMDGNKLLFATREQAVEYLTTKDIGYGNTMGCTRNSDDSYSYDGTYWTSHGEYTRPVYRIIRKARAS